MIGGVSPVSRVGLVGGVGVGRIRARVGDVANGDSLRGTGVTPARHAGVGLIVPGHGNAPQGAVVDIPEVLRSAARAPVVRVAGAAVEGAGLALQDRVVRGQVEGEVEAVPELADLAVGGRVLYAAAPALDGHSHLALAVARDGHAFGSDKAAVVRGAVAARADAEGAARVALLVAALAAVV